VAPWPPGSRAVPTALAPDAGSHLSDGVVVETRLVARVLGLKLLRIDGLVLLAPARLGRQDSGSPVLSDSAAGTRAAPLGAGIGYGAGNGVESGMALAPGTGLDRARFLLHDCDRRLSGPRRPGRPASRTRT
jgi:hypothetical protein